MDQLTTMRLEFNRILLDSIGSKILNTPVFSWQAGFTQGMLGICLAVAFFQSVLKDEKSMLVEWTKIVIAAWFAMAVLGGVSYQKVPLLKSLDNVTAAYKVKGSNPTLERALFNNLSYQFDSIGEIILAQTKGTSISKEVQDLGAIQDRLLDAMIFCNQTDINCMKGYVNGTTKSPDEKPEEIGSGLFGTIKFWSQKGLSALAKVVNPATWLFPILNWILEIFRGLVNQFVLLSFGIIAAISLIFLKVLTVFLVLPSFRGRVLSMWKDAMSVTLYGFVMNLIIWVSIVVTQALNEATVKVLLKMLDGLNSGASSTQIYSILIANSLTSFVLLFLQIVALGKVPKFCKQFMNLSLEQIVNIGETLIQAGMGMAKMAGSLALGGAALAGGALGGLAMKGMSSAAGGAMNSLSNSKLGASVKSAATGVRDKIRGFSDDDPMGGSGGGGLGGGGGKGLGRGFGSDSLEKTALADTNLKASMSGKSSVLKKEEEKKEDSPKTAMDEKKEAWDKKVGMFNKVKDGAVSGLKNLNEARKQKGLTLGNMTDKMHDVVWDAMEEGAGSGDMTKGLKAGLSTASKDINSKEARQGAQALGEGVAAAGAAGVGYVKNKIFANEPKLSNAERSMKAEQIFQTAAFKGKENTTEADNEQLSQNLQAIATGTADQSQFLQVMQAQNTKNLSQDQMKEIAEVRKNNVNFDKFAKAEESRNAELMTNIQKEIADKGQISDKSLDKLAGLTSSGMVDLYQVASMKVTPNGTTNETAQQQSFAQSMQNLSKQEMDTVVQGFEQKLQNGQALKQSELQTATQLFETQKSSLVGDQGRVGSFNNILSNKVDSKHLVQERDKTVDTLSKISQGLEKKASPAMTVVPGLEAMRKMIDESGVQSVGDDFEGLSVNGQKVSSFDDYKKLDEANKKIIDDIVQKMDLAEKDQLTNEMLSSKLEKDFTNSNEFKNLQNFIKNIKKG